MFTSKLGSTCFQVDLDGAKGVGYRTGHQETKVMKSLRTEKIMRDDNFKRALNVYELLLRSRTCQIRLKLSFCQEKQLSHLSILWYQICQT